MELLNKINRVINEVFMCVAGIVLAAMIILTCANIFCRLVWLPIRGTFELMGYFGAVITAFALGYTQIKKGHIAVDIVILGFSPRLRSLLNGINSAICLAFFVIVGWQIWRYATNLWRTGEVTETLRIIYYPFTYAVALGCFALAFVFLVEFLNSLVGQKEDTK
ncbi:MAG: TRAP transporter small permease [Deltaproteobacteria bacterium]|nr:MAG: TRAP transporter small permease [Deltaproteobacteria bacterium]RLB81657.1 MAG: TRAP transporter small permease [Deltaproteobacteria bacterium]